MGALAAPLREAGARGQRIRRGLRPADRVRRSRRSGVRCLRGLRRGAPRGRRPDLVVVGNAIRRDQPRGAGGRARCGARARRRCRARSASTSWRGAGRSSSRARTARRRRARCARGSCRARASSRAVHRRHAKGLPAGAAIGVYAHPAGPRAGRRSSSRATSTTPSTGTSSRSSSTTSASARRRRDRDERRARPRRHLPGRGVVRSGVPRASSARVPAGGLIVCDAHDARAREIVVERGARAGRLVRARRRRHRRRDADVDRRRRPRRRRGRRRSSICSRAASRAGASRWACPGTTTCATRSPRSRRAPRGSGRTSPSCAGALAGFEGVQPPPGPPRRAAAACGSTTTSPITRRRSTRRCAALRGRHPGGALWVAFEPRSATACRALHQEAYARAFDAADHVLFAPLGRSEHARRGGLDLQRLPAISAARRARCRDVDAIVDAPRAGAAPGDTIALLSNGAFGGIHGKLLDAHSGDEVAPAEGSTRLGFARAPRASRSRRRARPAALAQAGWRTHPRADHKGRVDLVTAVRPRRARSSSARA